MERVPRRRRETHLRRHSRTARGESRLLQANRRERQPSHHTCTKWASGRVCMTARWSAYVTSGDAVIGLLHGGTWCDGRNRVRNNNSCDTKILMHDQPQRLTFFPPPVHRAHFSASVHAPLVSPTWWLHRLSTFYLEEQKGKDSNISYWGRRKEKSTLHTVVAYDTVAWKLWNMRHLCECLRLCLPTPWKAHQP